MSTKYLGFILTSLLIISSNISIVAQPDIEYANLKAKYPDETGVWLNLKENVTIGVNKSGDLEIISNVYEERMLLNDNAKFFSEDQVSYSSFIKVEDVEPEAWLPGSKKWEKIKVKDFKEVDDFSSNSFYDDTRSIKFYYPSLGPGTKTSLSYKEIYQEPRFFGHFFFGSFLPVEQSEYIVTTDKNIKINYKIFGIDEDKIHFSKTEAKNSITYKWTVKDLKKYRSEANSVTMRSVLPHMVIYVTDYEVDGKNQKLLSNVGDLHEWYKNFLKEAGSGKEPDLLKHVVDSLQNTSTSEYELVEQVYYWVQDNIKYIAIEDGLGGFIPRDATTVYHRRYGDCKDMANIIHEMLNVAKVPTHLTWIGTRDIPYSYNEVPTPMVDNHMICTYKENGKYYFLDATNQYTPMTFPSSFIQGKEALINLGDGSFEIIEVPVIDYKKNYVIDSTIIEIKDGKVKGAGKAYFGGYDKINVTHNLSNLDNIKKQKYLKALFSKGHNKFFIENISETNLRERNKPLSVSYDFTLDDYARNFNNEIFINPHLSRPLQGAQIDTVNNKFDKERDYKFFEKNVVTINIPEGFELSYLPKNTSHTDNDFSFNLTYTISGNKIIVDQDITLDHLVLKSNYFSNWNKMISALNKAYNETIILKKKI